MVSSKLLCCRVLVQNQVGNVVVSDTFTNILLTTSVLFGVFYVLTNALQAEELTWAQPVADLLSTTLATLLCLWTSRKMMAEGKQKF